MRKLLSGLYRFEIYLAVRLGAFGDYWAGRAWRRLGELTENSPSDRSEGGA